MGSTRQITKVQGARLRELCGLAHERELSTGLARLEEAFRSWRASALNAFELSDLIHQFHDGASRKLFARYHGDDLRWLVASAIHRGVLVEAEVGPQVLELLRPELTFFRDQERAAQPVAAPDERRASPPPAR